MENFLTSLTSYNIQCFQRNSAQKTACLFQKQFMSIEKQKLFRQDIIDICSYPIKILKIYTMISSIFISISFILLGGNPGRGGYHGSGIYNIEKKMDLY